MNKLLRRLLGYLFPGVDEPELDLGDPGGDPDPGNDPPGDLDIDDEIELDFVEPTAPRRKPSSVDERLAGIENSIAEARRMAESRTGLPSSTAPAVDPDYQREEERLRAADVTELERWQINSNRSLRQNQQMAAQALFQAQDLNDRTKFETGIASDPHRARYRDKVEAAVQAERQQGRNVSREAVYYHMLGKDIAEGKLKAKPKAKTPAADIPRGRTPGVRSNVSQGRGMNDHQKRAARLADVNI